MIKNYLLITWRSMMKNKLFIFINILGMAISIASCIVAWFNYDFNRGFDSHHKDAATIYRINSIRKFQNETTKFGYVPLALGNAIADDSDISRVIRYSPSGANFRVGEEMFNTEVVYVDTGFFEAFTYEFVDGTASLNNRSALFISDELAMSYFGTEKAAGKTITQMLDSGKVREYEVGGVFRKQPTNSSFYAQAFANFHNQFTGVGDYNENSWLYRATIFLQIMDPASVPALEARMKPLVENNNRIREDFIIREFQLQPFVGMAVSDSYDDVPGTWTREGSPLAAIIGVGLMGILVLLIACFNLTNTAIAISSRRLKEIGIRKVMGSMKRHLVVQFIGETMAVCFVALILGAVIAEFLLIPAFNQLWPEMKLETDYFSKPDFVLFLIGTLLFTAFLAGSYPALYVSRFQPTSILKGTLKFGGTNPFTLLLLILQFAISLAGIVCSVAFTDNARFQREFDMGFDKSGVLFTYVENRSEFETYRNRLEENHDIRMVAGSQHHIYSNYFNDPIRHEDREIEVDILDVGHDYMKAMGMTLTEGRFFTENSETDRAESVIVTEDLARKFGWDTAVGKQITWMDTVQYYVVGVIKDVYNRGLWEEKSPMMFRYGQDDRIRYVIVSTTIDKVAEINRYMESTWRELFPNRMYNGFMMDAELVEAHTVNNNIVKMFVFLGIVAMMLSATGLFTLVSLNMIRRMKEIGIRKVLGASMANIARVVNTKFAIILLISCVAGGVLGAFLSASLMKSIWDYYQTATPSTIVFSALILLVICFCSVAYKIYMTVRLNPSHVLKDE